MFTKSSLPLEELTGPFEVSVIENLKLLSVVFLDFAIISKYLYPEKLRSPYLFGLVSMPSYIRVLPSPEIVYLSFCSRSKALNFHPLNAIGTDDAPLGKSFSSSTKLLGKQLTSLPQAPKIFAYFAGYSSFLDGLIRSS